MTLTEDYRDFEWIVKHPAQVKPVTYYRDRLAGLSAARAEVRATLGALGLGNHLVIAMNQDPGANQALELRLGNTNAASSQITFESTDTATTKKGLLEGMTHGLNRRQMANRSDFLDADAGISGAVAAAAARAAVPNADGELIMAYVFGDLVHKLATLITGAQWGGDIAANFKQWRVLFPKSHPSQIMFQALTVQPTQPAIAAVKAALDADKNNIINDVVALFAQKIRAGTAQTLWQPGHFTALTDPGDRVQDAVAGQAAPMPDTLAADLRNFADANTANFMSNEFDNVVNALADYTAVAQRDVVRSSGFAVHGGANKGFAFEDRAEVPTTFPGLATTYARIKAIVNRY